LVPGLSDLGKAFSEEYDETLSYGKGSCSFGNKKFFATAALAASVSTRVLFF
jgi:hypothetical protein